MIVRRSVAVVIAVYFIETVGGAVIPTLSWPNATARQLNARNDDDCVACYGEIAGNDVAVAKYSGFSPSQQDLSCLDACRAHPACDFWVRSTTGSECWLKNGFREFVDPLPTPTRRGGFVKREAELGVVFIKQPKTGGETLAEILAQYASRYGRRQLHDRSCYPVKRNPLGQSTCACGWHFVRAEPGALPAGDPNASPRCSVLYTHMYYNPTILSKFMPAYAAVRRITILRSPAEVLKSAQKMAIVQHHSRGGDAKLNNSFCQFLADNTNTWLTQCPMATSGDGSILQYLDPPGHECLQRLLARAKQTLQHPDPSAAASCTQVASDRLEHEFVVGLQTHFDTSLLLFGAALQWDRADMVYSAASMVMHDTRSHPLAKKLDNEWATRSSQIIGTMRARFAPLNYHQRLFDQGVRVFERQVAHYLGTPGEVSSQLAAYQQENAKFTSCYERVRSRMKFNTCSQWGLASASAARRSCTTGLRNEAASGARGHTHRESGNGDGSDIGDSSSSADISSSSSSGDGGGDGSKAFKGSSSYPKKNGWGKHWTGKNSGGHA